MRKRLSRPGTLPFSIIALGVLSCLIYLLFFSKVVSRSDPTWTRIQQQGVIKIGIDPSFPPFEVDDGKGNLSGFDVALASALAARWNVRVQYVYTGYDGLYDALIGNQFDLILSALPYNPDKTQDVSFSHSYFDGGPILIVPQTDNRTKSLYDLEGRSVAVELGTSGDAFARKWQRRLKLDLKEFNTTTDALQATRSGQAAAAVVDPISFYDFQRAENVSLKIAGKTLSDEFYIIAVRKDSSTLLREIDSAIDTMQRNGSLQDLQKKWF